MAPPAGTLRVGRYFLALAATFIILSLIVFWPGSRHTPKLGLDLRGGAQVVYKAQTTNGKAPSSGAMAQAKSIINQRVNGLGVEQAEVVIQGSDEIVVTVPGKRADQLSDVGKTALLNFRPLVAGPFDITAPVATTSGSATPSGSATASGSASSSSATSAPTGSSTGSPANTAGTAPTSPASGQNAGAKQLAAPTSSPASSTPTVSPSSTVGATPSASVSPSAAATPTLAENTDGNQTIGFADLTDAQKLAIQNFKCGDTVSQNTKDTVVVCDNTGVSKYMLGPVLVPGTQIASASSSAPNGQSLQWAVLINLKASGDTTWAKYTQAHHNPNGTTSQTTDTIAADYVAFTLDDQVISNTNIQDAIPIGMATQVTGQFTQTQADTLANELKYGALPLKFTQEAKSTVSATLGSAQLKAGLLAGGIGLALVVVYSLIYYRALGLVTIASLLVSGGLTYTSLVILGTQIGFTLTLAGIAGFIVAVGITADSFVVLFERIKDEVHEGRTMRVAVPRAWVRARRTIISADIVSFLAAFVLYLFAAGDVRGFAFTLGMSTILDLVVVFLFTHPLVSLLSRSAAFGSARFTGLDAARVGGVAQAAPTAEARRQASAKRKAASAAGRRADTSVALMEDDLDSDIDDTDLSIDAELPSDGDPVNGTSVASSTNGTARGHVNTLDRGASVEDETTEAERAPVAPAAGTAAERAAARRAKMREEGKR